MAIAIARGQCDGKGTVKDEWRGIAISWGVWMGLLMMGGAALWFFLGLAVNRIFFYPPVLFVLGLVQLFCTLAGHED